MVFNSISTKSVSSVWQVQLKFSKKSGIVVFRDLAKIFGGGLGAVAKAFKLPTQKGEIDYRLNRLHNMVIHVFYALIHINRFDCYIWMCVFVYHEHLMCKSLSHPRYSIEIKNNFFKSFQTITYTFSL